MFSSKDDMLDSWVLGLQDQLVTREQAERMLQQYGKKPSAVLVIDSMAHAVENNKPNVGVCETYKPTPTALAACVNILLGDGSFEEYVPPLPKRVTLDDMVTNLFPILTKLRGVRHTNMETPFSLECTFDELYTKFPPQNFIDKLREKHLTITDEKHHMPKKRDAADLMKTLEDQWVTVDFNAPYF